MRILVTGLPYSGTSALGWLFAQQLGCTYLHEPFSAKLDPQHLRYGAPDWWPPVTDRDAKDYIIKLVEKNKTALFQLQFKKYIESLNGSSNQGCPKGQSSFGLVKTTAKAFLGTSKILRLQEKIVVKDPFALLWRREFAQMGFDTVCVVKSRTKQLKSFLSRNQRFSMEQLARLCACAGIKMDLTLTDSYEERICLATAAGELLCRGFENIVELNDDGFIFLTCTSDCFKKVTLDQVVKPSWLSALFEPSVSNKLACGARQRTERSQSMPHDVNALSCRVHEIVEQASCEKLRR